MFKFLIVLQGVEIEYDNCAWERSLNRHQPCLRLMLGSFFTHLTTSNTLALSNPSHSCPSPLQRDVGGLFSLDGEIEEVGQ